MSPLNTQYTHQIFNKLDKNGDGLVTIDELMWLLERIGVHTNRDELELFVGDKALGPVDFQFFCETLMNNDNTSNNNIQERKGLEREDDGISSERDVLREAFKVFDLNDDGFISVEELQVALSRLGLWDEGCGKDCRQMIRVYDTNSDGLLDFEEFKDMMSSDSLASA